MKSAAIFTVIYALHNVGTYEDFSVTETVCKRECRGWWKCSAREDKCRMGEDRLVSLQMELVGLFCLQWLPPRDDVQDVDMTDMGESSSDF